MRSIAYNSDFLIFGQSGTLVFCRSAQAELIIIFAKSAIFALFRYKNRAPLWRRHQVLTGQAVTPCELTIRKKKNPHVVMILVQLNVFSLTSRSLLQRRLASIAQNHSKTIAKTCFPCYFSRKLVLSW